MQPEGYCISPWKKGKMSRLFQVGHEEEDSMVLLPQSEYSVSVLSKKQEIVETNLSFTISPEVHSHADYIVDGRVRGLIQQGRSQCSQGQKHQSRLNTPVECAPSNKPKRPFPGKEEDAEHEVDDL